MSLLDLIVLPEITLKKLTETDDFSQMVDKYNFNLDQLLDHHRRILEISFENLELPQGLPGLSIVGGDGVRGNSLFPSDENIANNSPATNIEYILGDTVIDPSGSLFEIIDNNGQLIHSLVFTLDFSNIGSLFQKESSVVDTPTSHGFIKWDDVGNDDEGNIAPFTNINGDTRYYRMIVGDYRKSTSINATATFVNILEAESSGSGILTSQASNLSTSRDFAQIAVKYRKSYQSEVVIESAYHKFYEKEVNRMTYSIINGTSSLSLAYSEISERYAICISNHRDSVISLDSKNIKFFGDNGMRFYANGNFFIVEKNVLPTVQTFVFWMNLIVEGDLIVESILNQNGDVIMEEGDLNFIYIYNNLEQILIDNGFVQDSDYVHTDNNLTDELVTLINTKPDWEAAEGDNAGILNKPNIVGHSTYADGILTLLTEINGIEITSVPIDGGIKIVSGVANLINTIGGTGIWNDANSNYIDVYPPSGMTVVNNYRGGIASVGFFNFSGNVDDNDALFTEEIVYSNRIRFIMGGRETDSGYGSNRCNFLTIWSQ